ncbi:hypothetical protein SH1V18_45260 [Vallitalea longa]|uniref:Uncharacterized protein n=1 Tax=Vallitalea longa TaxID=2936439 RepID=A0A9W5YG52_9FIRM|nr:hypothetical protein [Vallitalea longa]GKX32046.1 hypothetical protein SH1V18_45260 [Vallitalea longa]
MKTILGFKVSNRLEEVDRVQDVLTEKGNIIDTRLGLHQDSEEGIILLELNEDNGCEELESKLNSIEGIEVKKITFS